LREWKEQKWVDKAREGYICLGTTVIRLNTKSNNITQTTKYIEHTQAIGDGVGVLVDGGDDSW